MNKTTSYMASMALERHKAIMDGKMKDPCVHFYADFILLLERKLTEGNLVMRLKARELTGGNVCGRYNPFLERELIGGNFLLYTHKKQ